MTNGVMEDASYDATITNAGQEGTADAFLNATFDLQGIDTNLDTTYTATWSEEQANQSTWSARLHAHQHAHALPHTLRNALTSIVPENAVVGGVMTIDRTACNVQQGTLTGERTVTGLSVGSYLVTHLLQDLTLDTYLGIGLIRTNLNVANDDVRITTHPTRPQVHAGLGITGHATYGVISFTPRPGIVYARAAGGTTTLEMHAFDTTERATLSTTAQEVFEASFQPRIELDIVQLPPNTWLTNHDIDLALTTTLACSVPRQNNETLTYGYGLQTALTTPITTHTTLNAGITYEQRTVHDLTLQLGLERTY